MDQRAHQGDVPVALVGSEEAGQQPQPGKIGGTQQKLQFDPPFSVSKENTAVTTVLQVSSAGWFRFNGALLDPTDKNNEGKIDENIKVSIKAKKK